jgi:predicted lipoprotein with Yx(FWY)xxD motif
VAPPPIRPRARRAASCGVLVATLLLSLAACGASGAKQAAPRSTVAAGKADSGDTESATAPSVDVAVLVQVQAPVLVDARGFPLYVYLPDHHRAVTCAGECAEVWPPVFVPRGVTVTAGTGVRPALLGTDPDPVAGEVVTYDHWPLYTYAGDPQPGFATGQGLDVDGGYWYLIRPDGSLIVPKQ